MSPPPPTATKAASTSGNCRAILPDEKLKRLYKEDDFEKFSSTNPEFVTVNEVKVPYAVFENEDDVTTDTPSLLAERLEEVLQKLWALKNE